MRKRIIATLLLAAIVAIELGCSSSRSTVFLRDENNLCWTKKCAKGVPITLKVPTHVKLFVYETHFLERVKVGEVERLQFMQTPVVVRDFAQDYIYTEKMIMVDFKRPAAGAFNLDVEMTEDQYISRIQHDVTDETISEVGSLLTDLIEADFFAPPTDLSSAGGLSLDNNANVAKVKSVVAAGVFEIDDPNFEKDIMEFVNCHINKPCSTGNISFQGCTDMLPTAGANVTQVQPADMNAPMVEQTSDIKVPADLVVEAPGSEESSSLPPTPVGGYFLK